MTKKHTSKVKNLSLKKGGKSDLTQSLQEEVTKFEKSMRFQFLKTFSVFHTVQLHLSRSQADLTFEELALLGAKEFITRFNLASADLNKLKLFLQSSTQEQSPSNNAVEKISEEELSAQENIPIGELGDLHSTATRNRLTGSIGKLKSSTHFASIREKTLEEFWSEEWPRAPFEETLTIKQICDLNIDNFLKKRSLVPHKVAALIGAIENALAWKNPQALTIPPSPSLESKRNLKVQHGVRWQAADSAELPSYARNLVSFYDAQLDRVAESPQLVGQILSLLPRYINAKNFLILWFSQEHSPALVAEMLKVSSDEIEKSLPSARRKVFQCLTENFPGLVAHWESILSGPGVPMEALVKAYSDENLDKEFQASLWALLLSAFNIRHPAVGEHEFKQFWTANDQNFALCLRLLWSSLPKSNFEIKRELKVLFPYFDQNKIIAIFSERARYNEKTDLWALMDNKGDKV